MNVGIIAGSVILFFGIALFAAAGLLKLRERKEVRNWLPWLYFTGAPLLFLVSCAGFRECYLNSDWSKAVVPFGLLCLALNSLSVGRRILSQRSRDETLSAANPPTDR